MLKHGPPGIILATAMILGHKPAGLTCKSVDDTAAAHDYGPATAHSNTIAGGASC